MTAIRDKLTAVANGVTQHNDAIELILNYFSKIRNTEHQTNYWIGLQIVIIYIIKYYK